MAHKGDLTSVCAAARKQCDRADHVQRPTDAGGRPIRVMDDQALHAAASPVNFVMLSTYLRHRICWYYVNRASTLYAYLFTQMVRSSHNWYYFCIIKLGDVQARTNKRRMEMIVVIVRCANVLVMGPPTGVPLGNNQTYYSWATESNQIDRQMSLDDDQLKQFGRRCPFKLTSFSLCHKHHQIKRSVHICI